MLCWSCAIAGDVRKFRENPPRSDSQITLQNAKKLGVPVKMITVDQVLIAKETSRQLGLGQNIIATGIYDCKHWQRAAHKWFTHLAVGTVIAHKIGSLNLKYPTVSEELKQQLLEAKKSLEGEVVWLKYMEPLGLFPWYLMVPGLFSLLYEYCTEVIQNGDWVLAHAMGYRYYLTQSLIQKLKNPFTKF